MLIDISRNINSKTEIYDGDPVFSIEMLYDLKKGAEFSVSRIVLGSHMSTHIDSPAHFFAHGATVDMLDINTLCGETIVVTVKQDIDGELAKKIVRPEKRLILRTGGNFGITKEGAEYIAGSGLALVGTDAMDIESAKNAGYEAHKILLGAGVPILEFLNLENVLDGCYRLLCLPLKIDGADAAPVRAVLEV